VFVVLLEPEPPPTQLLRPWRAEWVLVPDVGDRVGRDDGAHTCSPIARRPSRWKSAIASTAVAAMLSQSMAQGMSTGCVLRPACSTCIAVRTRSMSWARISASLRAKSAAATRRTLAFDGLLRGEPCRVGRALSFGQLGWVTGHAGGLPEALRTGGAVSAVRAALAGLVAFAFPAGAFGALRIHAGNVNAANRPTAHKGLHTHTAHKRGRVTTRHGVLRGVSRRGLTWRFSGCGLVEALQIGHQNLTLNQRVRGSKP
jgi:hypothetical protein